MLLPIFIQEQKQRIKEVNSQRLNNEMFTYVSQLNTLPGLKKHAFTKSN